jgi:hypothetical protein
MRSLARDRELMGGYANGRRGDLVALVALVVVAASVVGLAVAVFL